MIRVGALAPLSWPGLVAAGRELRDGLELAVEELNSNGGIGGEQIDLMLRDSRGDATEAIAAVDDLAGANVVAVVGEFHSVVADRVADRVEELELPFVCSSATLDALTSRRGRWLFRIAPPQAYGWGVYADFLHASGSRHVALAITSDVYWESGAAVLTRRLRDLAITVRRLDVTDGADVVAEVAAGGGDVDALLLLVGYPSPLSEIVAAVRADARYARLLVGDPAGRAAFGDWWDVVGADGVGVPYLAYLPRQLPERGREFAASFEAHFGREPTFVAFEGYDTILVLAAALARAPAGAALREALAEVIVDGSRGPISFASEPTGVVHQQWAWPPVAVVAAPAVSASPSQMGTLHRGDP